MYCSKCLRNHVWLCEPAPVPARLLAPGILNPASPLNTGMLNIPDASLKPVFNTTGVGMVHNINGGR